MLTVAYSVIIPCVLVVYLLIIDFIDLYPFNDVSKHTRLDRKAELINYCLPIVAAISSWFSVIMLDVVSFFIAMLFLVGHILAWWIPYFRGHWSDWSRKEYEYAFGNTIKILPSIKDHPTPDLEHMIAGVLIVLWFIATLVSIIRVLL